MRSEPGAKVICIYLDALDCFANTTKRPETEGIRNKMCQQKAKGVRTNRDM